MPTSQIEMPKLIRDQNMTLIFNASQWPRSSYNRAENSGQHEITQNPFRVSLLPPKGAPVPLYNVDIHILFCHLDLDVLQI